MSRVAKMPINLPKGIEVNLTADTISIKGPKGNLSHVIHPQVKVAKNSDVLEVTPANETAEANALAGTTRAIVSNLVIGAHQGFERKLELVGVGYRAQLQGSTLNLTLGLSQPVNYEIPAGIAIEVPSQTQVIIKGLDKQLVGAVAAEIRSFRSPEPYKGKGIRYADEVIILKETKKK